VITWDSRSLYDPPATGVCAVSGAYETGRFYVRDGKRVFVGNTKAPEVVEDYVGFLTASGTTNSFKRGYPKREAVAASLPAPKKPKKK
jgi:hypothetical protein